MVEHVILPLGYLTMTPHREVEGEVPLEEEGAGGEPLEGEVVGGRATTGGRGQKERTLTDLGVLSSRPSSREVPSSSEVHSREEEEEEEEEVGEEVGEEEAGEEEGGGGDDGGDGKGVDKKGWLRVNGKLPKQVPANEEQKWLIEPTGKE